MKIIDGLKYIDSCYENGKFSKSKWNIYIENICLGAKKLIEIDSADYDFIQDILPVLNLAYSKRNSLETLHRSFCRATYNLEDKIRSVLHMEIDADVVLCLGLCNGAGWATKINGRPTVLLGIEKIIELDWCDESDMIGLIYHELGHLWHEQSRSAEINIKTYEDKALWQLYSEGVAMYFEQLLCENERFYHQDKNGWLDWCKENRRRLFVEYLERIEKKENIQDFFGDWQSFEGYSDIGYFLGAELVRSALYTLPIEKILNFTPIDIKQHLQLCLNDS